MYTESSYPEFAVKTVLVYRGQHVVVRVDNERSSGFQPLENLEFRRQYPLSAAEVFDVGDTDICYDGHCRQSGFCQDGNFTLMVHSHLNNRRRMFSLKSQKDFRHTYRVIEVTLRLVCVVFRAQYVPDHLFRRRLADAAGQGNNRYIKASSVGAGEVQKSLLGVSHADHRHVGLYAVVMDHNGGSACLDGRIDELMSVKALALYRYKKRTGFYFPVVYYDGCYIGMAGAESSAGPCYLFGGNFLHQSSSFISTL